MKRDVIKTGPIPVVTEGKVKAILRGGTFHRIQVLVDPSVAQIEHGGLSYRVTRQKDSEGRVICTWFRE